MKSIAIIHNFWKIPLCGLMFFLGFIPGSQLAATIGLTAPGLPLGANQATLAQYTMLASVILALGLSILARGISGSFFARWMILFGLTWFAYGVNNYLEAAIFTTMSDVSLYTVALYFPASLLCSAAVAWLFPSKVQEEGFISQVRSFFEGRTPGSWAGRLLAAFLAFPVVYLLFGRLIAPIVLPYYVEGANQLTLPGWDLILPVAALRSLLFLVVCLPVVVTWKLSDRHLFLALGFTLFLLVGGLGMLYAYWLPPILRITHGLEIFADEMVYTGALLFLVRKPAGQLKREYVSAAA
jgi:hypothetical protein